MMHSRWRNWGWGGCENPFNDDLVVFLVKMANQAEAAETRSHRNVSNGFLGMMPYQNPCGFRPFFQYCINSGCSAMPKMPKNHIRIITINYKLLRINYVKIK